MMTKKIIGFASAFLPSTGVFSSADAYDTIAPNAKDVSNFDMLLIVFLFKRI